MSDFWVEVSRVASLTSWAADVAEIFLLVWIVNMLRVRR